MNVGAEACEAYEDGVGYFVDFLEGCGDGLGLDAEAGVGGDADAAIAGHGDHCGAVVGEDRHCGLGGWGEGGE